MIMNLHEKNVRLNVSIDPDTFLAILTFAVDDQFHTFKVSVEQLQSLKAVLLGVSEEKLNAIQNILTPEEELARLKKLNDRFKRGMV